MKGTAMSRRISHAEAIEVVVELLIQLILRVPPGILALCARNLYYGSFRSLREANFKKRQRALLAQAMFNLTVRRAPAAQGKVPGAKVEQVQALLHELQKVAPLTLKEAG